jgi:hypothetical protein
MALLKGLTLMEAQSMESSVFAAPRLLINSDVRESLLSIHNYQRNDIIDQVVIKHFFKVNVLLLTGSYSYP